MKKGFTLIEVLAVLVIMAILLVICVPLVINNIKTAKESSYEEQVNLIIKGAKSWGLENSDKLPLGDETYSLTIDELLSSNVLENKEIINPKTKEKMGGCVKIRYDNDYNQYTYNYYEVCN